MLMVLKTNQNIIFNWLTVYKLLYWGYMSFNYKINIKNNYSLNLGKRGEKNHSLWQWHVTVCVCVSHDWLMVRKILDECEGVGTVFFSLLYLWLIELSTVYTPSSWNSLAFHQCRIW